jgi:hypothetical protein
MTSPTALKLPSVATLVIASFAAGTSALAHCCAAPPGPSSTQAVFA